MERARATWTDERLDDLARTMEGGFSRLDEDLRSLRTELGARIDAQGVELGARIEAQGAGLGSRIDAQGAELGSRIGALEGQLDARFDSLQRTMLQVGGGTIAAILAAALSVIATQG